MSYDDDRRVFHAMKLSGWKHDPATGGFTKLVTNGAIKRRLWVSWGQAESALRLADEGEKVQGVVGQSETLATIINSASNDRAANDG